MPGTPCPCSVPTHGPHPKEFPYPIPRQPLFPGVLLTREDQETHGTCDHRAGDRNKHWEKHQKALRKDGKEENFLDSPGLPGCPCPCSVPSPGAARTPQLCPGSGKRALGGQEAEEGEEGERRGPRSRCRGKISRPEKGRGPQGGSLPQPQVPAGGMGVRRGLNATVKGFMLLER